MENRHWVFRFLGLAVLLLIVLSGALRADLKRALAEPNLEKRSGLALANAAAAYELARAAYERGDNAQVADAADEILDSVKLAYTSLTTTGKDPRKSPKWFKKAEIDTRNLLRKLVRELSAGDELFGPVPVGQGAGNGPARTRRPAPGTDAGKEEVDVRVYVSLWGNEKSEIGDCVPPCRASVLSPLCNAPRRTPSSPDAHLRNHVPKVRKGT
jgi:hypothetical protein